ncbi:MAG: PASTA domain-containing protein, partial [Candidatus Eremiobacteraeota bacterium]|nr:PASTA domain-containing protein [Candidatus Eremiobacteraeota bacterium]
YMLFGRPLSLPNLAATITVADYRNMTDAQAQALVVNAGLQSREIKTSSDTVPANRVIRQNPAAGAKVESNSVVELFVSNGLPLFGLRDVRGYSAADAARTLEDDKFQVKQTRRYSAVPKDSVIDQQPAAGSKVRQGSTVSLIISNGPQPAQAPNFVGMNVDDAIALAKKSGVSLDTSGRRPDPTFGNGVVAAQDVAPGQQIEHDTIVHATISTGNSGNAAASANVPNVVNMKYADAISQLNGGGFTAAVKFAVQAENNGLIVAQDPAPGTLSTGSSTVTVTLSVTGEVPDTEGLSMTDAQAVLLANGYRIDKVQYTPSEGADGKVIRTQPEVGTSLSPGAFVTLIVNGAQR